VSGNSTKTSRRRRSRQSCTVTQISMHQRAGYTMWTYRLSMSFSDACAAASAGVGAAEATAGVPGLETEGLAVAGLVLPTPSVTFFFWRCLS
jgi:hypothetical protein